MKPTPPSKKFLCVLIPAAFFLSAAKQPEWTPLFNSKDLDGWKSRGDAVWTVENECIVGKQGPGGAAGDLFTEKEYDDFELTVTFKMQWPGNSGVWFRFQDDKKTYQADILEYKNPVCYTGSLYCHGFPFLALNEDPELVKKDDWNTFKIRAQGDRLVITLNDRVTADVRDKTSSRGKIGFQVHAGDDFKDMKITIWEIMIRPLPPIEDDK